ncbi:hypothetical protein [Flavobacterium phragmitis]|uniref:Uncharacterized protein n=1 Tax=Flavobacterium phragmitis TaxID=739143 RepID=A0A1I1WUD5_9FLAO|nr:hypothetical protein [Flavobacterium phragmitis]SFD98652.1 hypothetical protein SAMN05216297_11745 [Flavobacterium phragmitis]
MENLKIKQSKSYCEISRTIIYSGENDELICRKVYQGDWGDWDDKPESPECSQNIDNEYNSPDAEA